MGLIDQIQGKRIYLDTNIFVYLFEEFAPYVSLLRPLIEQIENGDFHSVTSELTLAESLVKPIQDNNTTWQEVYKQGIQTSPTLSVCPINREILIKAANIRAQHIVKLPDAIHMATAVLSGCETFLTNDRQIKSIDGMKAVYLE
ncbi:MAG: PIN domain-containing protein [Candidatus Omnitrophota bacterium]|jgi:predicted nucleic acid-binding protein|nr:MAG: PIN domain-containing protein [Candidatus Omnitrophota bacterium]